MGKKIIISLVVLISGTLFFSSCQSEAPAPISIEGSWAGSNMDGTQILVTFCNSTKSSNGDNAKLRISIPDLIIYTSGSYSYSDGYASIAFRNTLSTSEPEFHATMVYDDAGGFTMKIGNIDNSFSMVRAD